VVFTLMSCVFSLHLYIFQESSSCGAKSSPNLLTACVRRRIPSDENLHDLHKRLPADCAPYSRWSRHHHCHPDTFPMHHCHQTELVEAPPPPCQRSPATRRHKCWPPEDEVITWQYYFKLIYRVTSDSDIEKNYEAYYSMITWCKYIKLKNITVIKNITDPRGQKLVI